MMETMESIRKKGKTYGWHIIEHSTRKVPPDAQGSLKLFLSRTLRQNPGHVEGVGGS